MIFRVFSVGWWTARVRWRFHRLGLRRLGDVQPVPLPTLKAVPLLRGTETLMLARPGSRSLIEQPRTPLTAPRPRPLCRAAAPCRA